MSNGNSSFWDDLRIDNRDNHIERQALANYERNRQSNNDKPSAGGRERADDEQHVRSDYKPGTGNTTNNDDGKNNGNTGNGNNANGNNGNGNNGNGNNGSGGNGGGGSKTDDDLETSTVDDVTEVTPGDDVNEVEAPDNTEDSAEDDGEDGGEDGGEDDGMSM